MADQLPPFTSTRAEIKLAVEQNAIDRGTLFIRVIVSLDIDGLFRQLEQFAYSYDKEEWRERAESLGIDNSALDLLDANDPPIPYVYYFSTPELFVEHPRFIFYFRNVAMLSSKVVRGIGLDTVRYENGQIVPDADSAIELSRYFNRIVSALVLAGGVTKQRHIEMLMANLGDSLGGTSRNEVGRIAMMRLLNPLVRYIHERSLLHSIVYSYKGSLEEDADDSIDTNRQELVVTLDADIEALLADFERYRVKYHELDSAKWQSVSGRSSIEVGRYRRKSV